MKEMDTWIGRTCFVEDVQQVYEFRATKECPDGEWEPSPISEFFTSTNVSVVPFDVDIDGNKQ